jgi:hypothetical protein
MADGAHRLLGLQPHARPVCYRPDLDYLSGTTGGQDAPSTRGGAAAGTSALQISC